MAFEKLQRLGEERFRVVLNHLLQGKDARSVARMIQHEWKAYQDTSEGALTQQLNRFRLAAAEGAFGKDAALQLAQGNKPVLKALEGVSVSAMARMEELAGWQRDRVASLIEKERHLHTGPLMTLTNAIFNDYSKLLQDLQKMRFDLGLDEYKGPVSGMAIRGASVSTTLPDGTSVQRQVYEAVTTVEQIFDARKVPIPITG